MRFVRVGTALALASLACSAAAACSSSGTTGGSAASPGGSATASQAATALSGSCGKIPQQLPSDLDHLLSALPASTQAAYNLYTSPITASAYAHWKPAHPGPYTIMWSAGAVGDAFAAEYLPPLQALAKQHPDLIKGITVEGANYDVQIQIRQLQQAIQNKSADIIIAFPLSPTADAGVLEAAGKAGIPVITPLAASANPYEIGLNGNEGLQGAELMSSLAQLMGGKGNLLNMQGVPGIPANDGVLAGEAEVLNSCPGIQVVGNPVGSFQNSVAKTQTLQFLAAHPQPVNGVFQVGDMAAGIIQAFQQAGRTVPPIGDLGATPGALAYWSQNKGTYTGTALAAPTGALADASFAVALGLLQGRGVKINEILQAPLTISDSNLAQWVQPGWSLSTTLGTAPAPPGMFYPQSFLEQFFTSPAK